jgi:hypothetical protein
MVAVLLLPATPLNSGADRRIFLSVKSAWTEKEFGEFIGWFANWLIPIEASDRENASLWGCTQTVQPASRNFG